MAVEGATGKRGRRRAPPPSASPPPATMTSRMTGDTARGEERPTFWFFITAEMAVFYVAGYLVEERRRWPVIECFPARSIF